MLKRIVVLFVILLPLSVCCTALGHSHTHIGRNQDQTWGTADDNELWFFSMPGTPGWPDWGEPLELVYQTGGQLAGWYVCEELECWHSAHPDHGNWQLGGTVEATEPDWEVGIERISYTSGLVTLDESTLTPVLTSDGDKLVFEKIWMPNNYNENGTFGAWGFHVHTLFAVNGNGVGLGETFSAVYTAFDQGSTGYDSSDQYTISFVTVPEPTAVCLLSLGAILIRFRNKHGI
jgi:hypothetical protein